MRIVLFSVILFIAASAGPGLNGEHYTEHEKQEMNEMINEAINRVVRYFESRDEQLDLYKYSKAEQDFIKDKSLFEILPQEKLYCLRGSCRGK
ncbi:hypothetical protein PRIPAC_88672 [Pristionchus pacificus]|uniref:Uncharacterized protein n=1 Tax=Pristionchus pacificus TaxID=54126 RepID=A0A2A6CW45_PRIPA|nr:hypothetical protein PRIPAC_88672 [Pristionchus pacificus]|eukprot:PDM82267.1 hypothetical protein PRIPAC_36660 [Pristionchus pacificus]